MANFYPYRTAAGELRYRIIYRDASNKQTSKRGFRTQAEAKRALGRVVIEIEDGKYIPHKKGMKTVGELSAAWLATKKASLKRSSYTALDASWRTHVKKRWADVPVKSISTELVQEWANGLERSATTKRRAVEVLAGILDTAVPKLIRENPARSIKLPPKVSASRHKYLTHKQLWDLANAAGEHQLKVLTLGYCGIRWGELTALTTEALDRSKQVIHVTHNVVKIGSELVEGTPKTHKIRRVPVPTEIWTRLQEQAKSLEPGAVLFGNQFGNYISPPTGGASARTWWNAALKTAGLPYMPIHDLRHTAASLAVRSGAHVKIVQRMLGHRSAAVTLDIYTDLFEDDFDDLIERLDSNIAASVVARNVAKGGSGGS